MAATANDSYCATSDVESRVRLGAFSDSPATTPTLAEVLEFQAHRAGELYSVLDDVMGADAPGPESYATKLSDISGDPGKALTFAVKMFNAIGAAMDALDAAGANQAPARSERVKELGEQYAGAKEAIEPLARLVVMVTDGRAVTHISKGEITKRTVVSREEQELVTDEQRF